MIYSGCENLHRQILARQGVRVTGICSAANRELILEHGATEVVDYARGPLDVQMKDALMDVVIDCVGSRDTEAQAVRL